MVSINNHKLDLENKIKPNAIV